MGTFYSSFCCLVRNCLNQLLPIWHPIYWPMVPHCDASALLGICCNQCYCKRRHLLDHLVYTIISHPRDWLSGQLDDIFCVYLPSYDAEVATRDHETWNVRLSRSIWLHSRRSRLAR